MSSKVLIFWIASVVFDTTGHLAFKSAATAEAATLVQRWKILLRSPRLWTGIICFVLEFAVWFALISLIPLSQAVLIGSINIVAVMIAGRLLFKEQLDGFRIAGMSLIAVGVALAGGTA